MTSPLLYVRLIFCFLLACSPERRNEENIVVSEIPPEERAEKALLDDVIDTHDEIMPKMDDLMMLKAQLQKKLDSLIFEEADGEELTHLKEKIDQLEKADSAMMTWMRQFKAVRDTVTHEQRIRYLEQEKERIEKVEKMMNNAIEDARKAAG